MTDTTKPFRVLCLDGGGMKGLYSAVLMDTLVKRMSDGNSENTDIGKAFDLIVGTSTGGIIAAGLACGIPISGIIKFYKEHSYAIFIAPAALSVLSAIPKILDYPLRSSAAMRQESLKIALQEQFGKITIGELWEEREIAICIPTVNMATQKAWVFKTPHINIKNRDNGYSLVDVCLATSAAPTYFPLALADDPEQENHYNIFADGGLWANNPSLIGLIEALEITKDEQDIEIISVGTLSLPIGRVIGREEVNLSTRSGWGFGRKVVETCFEAQTSSTEFMLKFITPHLKSNVRYIRLGTNTPSNEQTQQIGLDKADDAAISVLNSMARDEAENNILGVNRKISDEDLDTLKDIIASMPSLPEENSLYINGKETL